MLPIKHKLTSPAEFSAAVKKGRRAGTKTVVVHVRDHQAEPGFDPISWGGPRFGLVVSKAVGNAVIRHRTSRRLRHVAMELIGELSPSLDIVIRANPSAGAAESSILAKDLRKALLKAGAVHGGVDKQKNL